MDRPAERHLLGVTFRTAPIAVWDALHFDVEHALDLLRDLGEADPRIEVLVHSTFDRSEFYLVPGAPAGTAAGL
jgi:glutamyl-tRNA reductase